MRHAAMYQGAFERNFEHLKPGTSTFVGTDDATHPLPAWPAGVDGVRIGYMEKTGKKFCVVRLQFGASDVILEHAMVIDLARYFGYGKRLGPEPTLVDDDDLIVTLLEDAIRRNPGQGDALMSIRRAIKGEPPKPKTP